MGGMSGKVSVYRTSGTVKLIGRVRFHGFEPVM